MVLLCSLVIVVLSSLMFSFIKLSHGLLTLADDTSKPGSYGTEFWLPFPGVAVTDLTPSFHFRVCATNPNKATITVAMSAIRQNAEQSWSLGVQAGVTSCIEIRKAYMIQGEGIFRKYAKLTSSNNFGVYVMATEKMDAFTALPVASWGNRYMAASYCGQSDGPCQIVIIASVVTKVVVTLPVQEDNMKSLTRAPVTQVSKTLQPGQVYQLQRNFDITGAIISANESVGVLTGSAKSTVAMGGSAGAFMEFIPPIGTLGLSFVVYKTPPWSSSSDVLRVVALNNGTNVHIWTGYQRIQLQRSQYITRKFDENVLLVEADQPIMAVKYCQNEGYPTMTIIQPTALFLLGETVTISEVMGLSNQQQFIVVVATTDFIQHMNLGSAELLRGTNMAAVVVTVSEGSGNLTLVGPKHPKMNFMVYSYLTSDTVSCQTAVAFYMSTINQQCSVTRGSPGDHTDNDCDDQIDEDVCSESNYMSFSDCGVIISGEPDVWGREFSLQVPDHCYTSVTDDVVLLYVAARSAGTAVQVTVGTPADPAKINQTVALASSDNYKIVNLTGAEIKEHGSKLVSGRTLHISSSAEVSVTLLQVCTSVGSESIMATRLMPQDVLGTEYFAVTLCNVDLCQIQVAAFHQGTTHVRIRLRLEGESDPSDPFMFNSVEYEDGEEIDVSLSQYQSLQLQSNMQDLTGSHILASKPVAVFSGGRYTMFKKMHMSNGFVEQLPPVETWGRYFIVQSSPVTKSMNKCSSRLCLDYLKVVASTADTIVKVQSTKEISYTLSAAGDFLEIPLLAVYSTVESSKPVLVLQLTQEVNSIALSGSIVTPRAHYLSADRVTVPVVAGVNMYLMINTDLTDVQPDELMVNSRTVSMTSSARLNASFYASRVPGKLLQVSSHGNFGGHVYSSGNLMAGLFRLAYAMNKINPVCVLSKGIPGDNRDNDCDGQVDEEPCHPSGIATDLDEDGMTNEDCALPPAHEILARATDFVHCCEIVRESDYSIVSSMGEETGALIKEVPLSASANFDSSSTERLVISSSLSTEPIVATISTSLYTEPTVATTSTSLATEPIVATTSTSLATEPIVATVSTSLATEPIVATRSTSLSTDSIVATISTSLPPEPVTASSSLLSEQIEASSSLLSEQIEASSSLLSEQIEASTPTSNESISVPTTFPTNPSAASASSSSKLVVVYTSLPTEPISLSTSLPTELISLSTSLPSELIRAFTALPTEPIRVSTSLPTQTIIVSTSLPTDQIRVSTSLTTEPIRVSTLITAEPIRVFTSLATEPLLETLYVTRAAADARVILQSDVLTLALGPGSQIALLATLATSVSNVASDPFSTSALTSFEEELAVSSTAAVRELAVSSTAAVRELAVTSTAAVRELAVSSTAAVREQAVTSTAAVRELPVTSTAAVRELAVSSTAAVRELAVSSTATVWELAVSSTAAVRELAVSSTTTTLEVELSFSTTKPEIAVSSSSKTEPELLMSSVATQSELALSSTMTTSELELSLSTSRPALAVSSIVTTSELELSFSTSKPEIAMSSTAETSKLTLSSSAITSDPRNSCVNSQHPWGTTTDPGTALSAVSNGIACGCHCPRSVYTSVLDSGQVAEITLAIQKELSINKNEVSASRRKYISIDDHRPSAQTVGYFGIGIVIATFLGIFLLDVTALTRDIAGFVHLCRVHK